jgi:hypothetical protein
MRFPSEGKEAIPYTGATLENGAWPCNRLVHSDRNDH